MSELEIALTEPLPYEMVTLPENEDFNLELFYDYWQFSDFSQHQFVYKLKELMIKYQLKSINTVQKVAKKTGYLAFKKILECGTCEKIFTVSQRKDIDFDRGYFFKEKLICEPCRVKAVELQVKKYIHYFQNFLSIEKDVEVIYPTQELTYLEKIFIYCLLSKISLNSKNIVKKIDWDAFIAVEANGVEFVLQAVIKKGYILKSQSKDELWEKQNQLRQIYWKYEKNLNKELKQEVNTFLRLNFDSEINVILPEKYKTTDDWIESLYEEIIASKLSIKDCKDLEKFIISKRLKETYGLVGFTCNYRKVPYEKDSALEFELMRMLNSFNLRYIFSILAYQAKEASAELYKIEHEGDSNYRFRKNHIFRYKLANYLTHLLQNNKNPKFDRALPKEWTYSELENFIAAQVIGNYEHWEVYTPAQILALWVESVGMHNEEENL